MPQVEQPKKPKIPLKYLVIPAAGLLLLFIAAGVWQAQQAKKGQPVCAPALLREARAQFDPARTQALKASVQKIQRLKGYTTDANCMYVVTYYYINAGDAMKAQEALVALKKAYRPATGFSDDVTLPGKDILFFESNVKFLQDYATQVNHNAKGSAK